jgi:CBS domain-containing membrane protein
MCAMSTAIPPLVDVRSKGWFVLWASAVAIALVGLLATLTHQPWVFPSLGPTAYVIFAAPFAEESSPRNTVCGHAIGIVAGLLALTVFGLRDAAPDLEDLTPQRLGAVVVALALTLSVMTWLGVPHAPAGATTLIVALGLLHTPRHLALMMLSVIVMVVAGYAINRLHGDRPPVWAPEEPSATIGRT